jgi:hypothetical protein
MNFVAIMHIKNANVLKCLFLTPRFHTSNQHKGLIFKANQN